MQGFLVKVVCSKHNTENWQLQEELLAVTQQGHLYFSLSWRIFYAFGLAVSYSFTLSYGAHCSGKNALQHIRCKCYSLTHKLRQLLPACTVFWHMLMPAGQG